MNHIVLEKKGITLIALIITIIILLILAGVTISLVVGDSGILTQSKNSSEKTIIGREQETISVSWSALITDKLTNDVEITDRAFERELIKNNNDVRVSYDANDNYLVHFNDTGHEYGVDGTGKLVEPEPILPMDPTEIIYVTLYTDGTLGFCSTEAKIEGKEVANNYTVPRGASYISTSIPWRNELSSITSVNFVDKIAPTSTSDWFFQCTNLTNIENIKNLNTSNVTNMSYMFYKCSNLTSLDVSRFDTSKVTNMSDMFCKCSNLTSLDVSRFDTSKVVYMSSMFDGCSKLTSLDVSNFDTSNVINMRSMFHGCSSLTNIDVSRFDTSKVTRMDQMFYSCENLTSLDVSNFDTSNVTDMEFMFQNCSNLTSLDASRFDTSKVTTMCQMFCTCSSLTSLDVSNFDTSNVTNMYHMFGGCENLTTIYVGPNWTTSSVTNSSGMFYSCTSLVGGNGTTYNRSNPQDQTYARVDTAGEPGYLTLKTN